MLAYLNGKYLPYADAAIPVGDYGFTMGVTVTEQLRTFNGIPHLLEQHLNRLGGGLKLAGIDEPDDLTQIVNELTEKNFANLDAGSDLSIGICVTPGNSRPSGEKHTPTVLVYNLELPFANWARQYDEGIQLTTVGIRETSGDTIPKKLKCRSRMHYYLAELEATQRALGSRALLLDQSGKVAEATTASVVIAKEDEIIAPPETDVLPSVALAFASQLGKMIGIKTTRRPISLDELKEAGEALWLSTPMGVLPVASIDQTSMGNGKPGQAFSKLITAWSDAVGLDIVKQAKSRVDVSGS